ncbi:maltose alpha-D-glucosyltransferase/alpha-amylase [Rhodopseudomonas julia]|uniref:Maltokinase n=1 Tax=Rhodopseudomonas julia TaxID=200617 RepID=A0ABU0C5S2_9BRAD|nr:maltose alpha-D-glucosyltransferase/alpha-amylase [Rhodopseudomonas julia]
MQKSNRSERPHHRIDGVIDRSDTEWYKDAIVYQLHVKAFLDSNGDGVGDFGGLLDRLDYIESLGVTAIWLLPFYPSPLRDDGYDIADYRAINPSYGTMRDFRRFVAEAHQRGIRVITELVINHTSDQHPWFQRARNAKPGSAARNYYVWSDTDQKYQGTRIIFLDTETSNWTWDPVAEGFFWHRFYSHQPDLNFDNPRVMKEVLSVMRFWLDMGVDGLRLDAIPYLVERDGTNNENLPETHVVLKQIRSDLDENYSDRMLLAEANQWPEDTRPYFGEGDECHMAFHFPLMPRMYMALAQEDRHPITDIIRQTPEIPDPCQWAIFLRNHDELTLEMVTDTERDYLWRTYASDQKARINLGIRRRLAPLMQNDRRKIELMNALLLSMPGTPVLYYGDEIGMGDNYFLGDRDGVRTPMQWSGDRNGGFSRANPQQLYLPPVQDPIHGYEAINVEAQQSDPSSLLNWMRRMVTVRKQHNVFGRGEMTFLYPGNRKILAYIRSYEDEDILCVANLSRSAQAVELDLSRFRHRVPVELSGHSAFPAIGELPYMLTLPGYGFFWFLLTEETDVPQWHTPAPDVMPEFITVTTRADLDAALSGRDGRQLEAQALPEFLQRQRWFAGKGATIDGVSLSPLTSVAEGRTAIATVDVTLRNEETQRYFLPLSALWGEENLHFGAPKLSYTLAKIRRGPRVGALVDAAFDEDFARALLKAMAAGDTVAAKAGELVFAGQADLAEAAEETDIRPLGVEQSNVSVIIGDRALLKVYRRLREGDQPEVEVARFLTDVAGFDNTPQLLGTVEYRPNEGEPTALAAVFSFVRNQGDGWAVLVDALDRDLEATALNAATAAESVPAAAPIPFGHPLDLAMTMGLRTAEMHVALAADTDLPAFKVEPLEQEDVGAMAVDVASLADQAIERLEAMAATLPAETREMAADLAERRGALQGELEALASSPPAGGKSRIHGDYHLGQVLVSQADIVIIDFEGEPQRSLAERRAKSSPLRDVAGMLRSFDYAAAAAERQFLARHMEVPEAIRERAQQWRDKAIADFRASYFARMEGVSTLPKDEAAAERLLRLFLLQKGFYEILYEAANRPDWIDIPLRGVLNLITTEAKL